MAARGRRPALYDGLAVARVLLARPDSPRDRKDNAVAELTELKIAKERGALVLREAAEGALSTTIGAARAAILRLPNDAIQRGVPVQYEEILRGLVEGVLTGLVVETAGAGKGNRR